MRSVVLHKRQRSNESRNFGRSPKKQWLSRYGGNVVSAGWNAVTRDKPLVNLAGKAAGRIANKLWKKYQSSKRTESSAVKKKRTYTAGAYQGKFVQPSKLLTKTSEYANKGILHTFEISGTVSDPDCVYLSYRAGDPYKIIQQAVIALMRKLFQKAGMNITNIDEILISTSLSTAVDWTVELTKVSGDTGVETSLVSYQTVAGSTLATVASQFYEEFFKYSAGYSYAAGGAAGVNVQLHRLILYQQDYNVTYGKVFKCCLNLPDEVMHLFCSAEMKIQNRTLSSTSDADVEDVGANPIIGRQYEFKSTPKLRDKAGFTMNGIAVNTGVQLSRAAALSSNVAYKEPPPASVFSNCVASNKVRLEPGAIKNSKIVYQKSMNLLGMLRKINLQYSDTVLYDYHGILPCMLFAFEDLISVNSNNLSCAYESNQIIGIYFSTHKKAIGLSSYASSSYSNNPA